MSGAMPSENVQRQLMHEVFQEQFVYVLFLRTHRLDYEAFTVIRSSEPDVVANFFVLHVSCVLGNTSVVMIISSFPFFIGLTSSTYSLQVYRVIVAPEHTEWHTHTHTQPTHTR